MPRYFAVLTIVLMLGLVLTRLLFLKKQGIVAMRFGDTSRIAEIDRLKIVR